MLQYTLMKYRTVVKACGAYELIKISHIQSAYGRKQVLADVCAEIEQGTCVGIIGANGCGKTTLLTILAGVRKPSAGTIFYREQEVNGKRGCQAYRRAVGYVPQESILIPELTVWDNLLLWYIDKNRLLYELEEGFLQELGLKEMCRMKVNQLSGGMKKRVSIGAALAQRPEVLILDEPGAALDLPGKNEVRTYLEKYKKQGGTIILATHDEAELELCDKLYVLSKGKCKEIDISLRGETLSSCLE